MAGDGWEAARDDAGPEAVSEVLRAVAGLEERPIDEHVGVFEHAHERLRHALDQAADAAPPPAAD